MKLIKTIAEFSGTLLSFIWPQRLAIILRALQSHIYTGYLRHSFKHIGEGTAICYPVAAIRGGNHISIGTNTDISRNIRITAWGKHDSNLKDPIITIGSDCNIGESNHFTAINGITIGDGLLTGSNVLITDNAHGASEFSILSMNPHERPLFSKGPVTIGKNVWIGNNVCILPNITIGEGVIIGANSVVTHDIPSFTIAAGIPAKVIKTIK